MAPTRSTAKFSRAVTAETKTIAVHESPQEDARDVDDSQASQASDEMDVRQIVQGMMKSVSGLYLMQSLKRPISRLLIPNPILLRPRSAARHGATRYGKSIRSSSITLKLILTLRSRFTTRKCTAAFLELERARRRVDHCKQIEIARGTSCKTCCSIGQGSIDRNKYYGSHQGDGKGLGRNHSSVSDNFRWTFAGFDSQTNSESLSCSMLFLPAWLIYGSEVMRHQKPLTYHTFHTDWVLPSIATSWTQHSIARNEMDSVVQVGECTFNDKDYIKANHGATRS